MIDMGRSGDIVGDECPCCNESLDLHFSDAWESNVRRGSFDTKCPNCGANLAVTAQMVVEFKVRVRVKGKEVGSVCDD